MMRLIWSCGRPNIRSSIVCRFGPGRIPSKTKLGSGQLRCEVARFCSTAHPFFCAASARMPKPRTVLVVPIVMRMRKPYSGGCEGMKKMVKDPFGQLRDVTGVNEYIGWYEHKPEDADNTVWQIALEKPLIVSEFGGDAKYELHGDASQRWTEEYQANIYQHQLVMLRQIKQLRGMSPWILMDFRSPRRPLPGVQDFFNRKGLVSEKGEKKQAFYILQKAYRERSVGRVY